ncbi:MAG: DUF4332 domain-containing protein [Candidatus Thermoplasmatota archaeon]
MKIVALLLALLVCAVAVHAQKPADAGQQGNGGTSSSNGQSQGSSAGSEGQGSQGNPPSEPGSQAGATSGSGNQGAQEPGQAEPASQTPSQDVQGSSAEPAQAPGQSGEAPGQATAQQSSATHGQSEASVAADPSSVDDSASASSHNEAPEASAVAVAQSEQAGQSSGDDVGLDEGGEVQPPAVASDASAALRVQRGAAGNRLAWEMPVASAAQVQVWRRDADGWTPIALASGDGNLVDPDGVATSEYRLTWSEEPLTASALAAVATSLSLAPALRHGGSGLGGWLLALLWAGVAAFATVRTASGPRRVLETRIVDDHQLLPLLYGVPGIDAVALDRVVALGLRTVGQLRCLDAQAVAFWTGLPAATIRTWQETLDLLQWHALPPGAAQRLAYAGHGTLAQVAAARPADLLATLSGSATTVLGPGLPADEQEVANWVVEARQALGLGPERTSIPSSPPPMASP